MADLDRYMREHGLQSQLDAIRAQPGGYEKAAAQYASTGTIPGMGDPTVKSADEVMREIMDELEAKYEELGERYVEFEEKNPFVFDEALARASSEERFSPYYEAELSDYLSGIERQRESAEGERSLLLDLNKVAAGKERRELEEAIRGAEEGYAGSGLFFSGRRKRKTGLLGIESEERERTRGLELGRDLAEIGRRKEELGTSEARKRRKIRAERESEIEQDIAEQKRQERAQYEMGRIESLGPEFVGRTLQGGGLQNMLNLVR